MPARDYPRLSYKAFGEDLLTTFDLDPIYPMLVRADIPIDMLKRWLLAYWCYYSAGVASEMAEVKSKHFYRAMIAGLSKKYPRGHERRHFRGEAAYKSIASLSSYGPPEKVVDAMVHHKDPSVKAVINATQSFVGFGPWISWKVADMAERVLCIPVDFSDADLYVYKDPVQGAALVKFGDKHHKITAQELSDVVDESLRLFKGYMAPPYKDRKLNIQEIETILCKWKAHMGGHYSLGLDSEDIAHGLQGWGDLAGWMYECLQVSTGYEI